MRLALLFGSLTSSLPASAQAPAESEAPPPAPQAAAVWYRSGEGCPDGAAFVELLRRRSVPAQLAQVGDRIDFVVTLGTAANGSRGRLERQAEQGTVALREVEGKTCEGVADALALSLALSWDPSTQRAATEATPIGNQSPAPVETAAPPPAPTAAPPPPEPPATAAPAGSKSPPRNFWLGVDGSLWTLSEQTPFFGGGVFGELRSSQVGTGFRPVVRLSAELAFTPDLSEGVQGWITLGRIEGCPVMLGTERWHLRPCTGFDLGVVRASGRGSEAASSNGFWAAWSTHARLSWEAGPDWGLDLQAGVIVPLTRYELTVGERESEEAVAKLRNWGLAIGIGAHWAPP